MSRFFLRDGPFLPFAHGRGFAKVLVLVADDEVENVCNSARNSERKKLPA